MKVSDFWPEKWLRPEHLNGKAYTLVISKVEPVEVMDPTAKQKVRKPAVSFAGATRPLILNKTQALAIQDIAGTEDMTRWPGTKVTLAPGIASNKKATIVCSKPAPAPAQPARTEQTSAGAAAPAQEEAQPAQETMLGDDEDIPEEYEDVEDESLGHENDDMPW